MVRSTFAVRETASLGQQMLNAPFGINGLSTGFHSNDGLGGKPGTAVQFYTF